MNNQQNNPARIRAKRLMNHYFSELFQKAGLHWFNDNTNEVNDLVDYIIDAAVAQIKDEMQPSEEEQAGKGYAEYFHGVKPRGNPSIDQALNEGDGIYRP